jgi:hypothetical protein
MQTNSMAQPEWKDSYPRLLSIKIDSHDDDVAHKLEPGREFEGGAEIWRRRYPLERSTLGETCHGEIGEKFTQRCMLDSVRHMVRLGFLSCSMPYFLRFDGFPFAGTTFKFTYCAL